MSPKKMSKNPYSYLISGSNSSVVTEVQIQYNLCKQFAYKNIPIYNNFGFYVSDFYINDNVERL